MDDPRMSEVQETGESQSEVSEVARQLDEATYAPESQVESTGTMEQAEAIEATFVEVVQTVDEVSNIPLPLPEPAGESSQDEVSAIPLPLPELGNSNTVGFFPEWPVGERT